MSLDDLVSNYAATQERLATVMRDFCPDRIETTLGAMKVTAPRVLDDTLATSARAFAAAVVEDSHAIARQAVALVAAEVDAAREALFAELTAERDGQRTSVVEFMAASRIQRADRNTTGL
jgi:hypothetical protein